MRILYLLVLAALLPCGALADLVSVDFSGVFMGSTIPGISAGSPFSGSFTYDTSAGVSDTQYFLTYAIRTYNPGSAGLTAAIDGGAVTVSGGSVQVVTVYDPVVGCVNAVNFHDCIQLRSGATPSGALAASGIDNVILFLGYPQGTFAGLDLPAVFPPTSNGLFVVAAGRDVGATSAGGFITATPAVPEPSSVALLLTAGAALGWRIRRRVA